MIEDKNKKKNKVIKGIALLGLFLMVFGISYALFKVTLNGKKTNKIKTGKMELLLLNENGETLEGDTIGIENALPISDEEGKSLTPYSFTLKNNGTIDTEYSITLNDLDLDEGEARLDDKYVTMYLVKGENLVEEIGPLSLATIKDRIIDAGVLKAGFETSYKLYTWVDISADTGASGKVFKTQLKVDGNQENDTTLSRAIIYRKDVSGYSEGDRTTNGLTSTATLYADGTFDIVGSGDTYLSTSSFLPSKYENIKEYQYDINLLKKANIDTSNVKTLKQASNLVDNLLVEDSIEICKKYGIDKLAEHNEEDGGCIYEDYAGKIKETNPKLAQKINYESSLQGGTKYYINQLNKIIYKYDNNISIIRLGCTNKNQQADINLSNNLKKIRYIRNCNLNELILPDTLNSIIFDEKSNQLGNNASSFLDTTIEELTIPSSVTYVAVSAFSGSNINKLNILGSTIGWDPDWNYGFNGIINNLNS